MAQIGRRQAGLDSAQAGARTGQKSWPRPKLRLGAGEATVRDWARPVFFGWLLAGRKESRGLDGPSGQIRKLHSKMMNFYFIFSRSSFDTILINLN
jgi:hypothetical protein